jgi:hypothetical protein
MSSLKHSKELNLGYKIVTSLIENLFKKLTGHAKDDDDSANKKPRNLPPDGTTFNQVSISSTFYQQLLRQ